MHARRNEFLRCEALASRGRRKRRSLVSRRACFAHVLPEGAIKTHLFLRSRSAKVLFWHNNSLYGNHEIT